MKSELRRNQIFIVLVITALMGTFIHSSVSIALSAIMKDLSISANTAQWLNSGYSLVGGIILPLTAFLTKRFTTRKIFYSSSLVLLFGLVLATFSKSFEILMLARVFQAIGSSVLFSLFQVTIMMLYPIEQRGKITGFYGLLSGIVSVFSPVISGVLVDTLGWQSIFSICIVVLVFDIIFGLKYLKNCTEVIMVKFDAISFSLSTLGIFSLLQWVGNISRVPLSDIYMVLLLVTSMVCVGLFLYRQLESDQPFLDIRLLKNNQLRAAVIYGVLLHAIIMAISSIMPIYLQVYRVIPATVAALISIPGTIVMAFANPIAGKFYDRKGIDKLLLWGVIMISISSALFGCLDYHTPLILVSLLTLVRSLGIGLILNVIPIWGISTIEKNDIGSANAIIQLLRTVAGSISSVLFVALATHGVANITEYEKSAKLHSGISKSFFIVGGLGLILVLIYFHERKKTKMSLDEKVKTSSNGQ